MRPTLALACVASAWLAAAPALAQNQVKPYFLVVFDTSGSMDDAAPANSCGFTTGGTPQKIDAAKCALNNLVNATGDADFGLMQFAKASGNTACGGASGCGPAAGAAWLRVPIQTNSATAITPLIDKVGNGPVDELCPGGYTPLGGTLIAARDYFEGDLGSFDAPTEGDTALSCRPLAVILLTDGAECCDSCMDAWSGCPKAAAALGISCPTSCGDVASCNGGDEHFENAPDRAYELRTETSVPSAAGTVAKGVLTYVIGFGITGPDARIENIAIAGGTDNPAAALRGFYADDEASLALAFSQIIADAQPPAEICNNLDDDCDTLIDEGIPKYCNKPAGITDPATCSGAPDPLVCCDEPEETLCDGEDDDCDGLIDEGVLNACGVCGDPPAEICDGLDNDCDSRVDEQTDGGVCGTTEGRCQEGMMRCIGGRPQCRGEVGPRDEICNCEDDDCDGAVDEDVDNDLCPDGRCIDCACVPRCVPGLEFEPECAVGRRADVQSSGECLCVIDNCDAPACAQMTLERDGETACAPDNPALAPCLCRAGACVARCDGVSCGSGQVCNPRTGRCAEDNCRGLGCPDGELCDPLEGECVTDACQSMSCGANEVCRAGACEPSCADVRCDGLQRCRAGTCVDDPCVGVRCDVGELCDPSNGECVATPCPEPCGRGLVCSVASGECERDPCWNLHCLAGQACISGECLANDPGSSGGSSGGRDAREAARVLATGGGGCACRVTPGSAQGERGTGVAAWTLVVLAAGLLRRRRRLLRGRAKLLAVGAALLAASALPGCTVSPFCIDCIDSGTSAGRAGGGGGGASGDAGPSADGSPGDAMADTGTDTGVPLCTNPEAETCDGMDQDCDFKVDEEVEADSNDCNQLGLCAGTQPICLNGEFTCRYPDEREDDETLCDAQDNDCDGRIDESHPTLGTACDAGAGACNAPGVWVCGDTGTDLRCDAVPLDPGDELCDGIDNDCDTLIDEPRGDPGMNPSFVADDVVQIGASLWIYRYEASRPDATDDDSGTIALRACSRANVLPWTNLTYAEAVAACDAAGMELCSSADWVSVCEGASACSWSFTPTSGPCPTGNTGYPNNANPADRNACNGHDLTAVPGGPDVDALAPTGSYPRCYTAQGGESVFDLSGNAKEWVTGANSPAENPLLGGSYNNLPGGLRCDFDFAVASDTVRLRNVGFRCCSATEP